MGKIQNREEYLKKLKSKQLEESEKQAQKIRFGLFSQALCLGIGDNKYKETEHKRGENGKPLTENRNVFQGPSRSGKGKKGYFQEMKYVSIDDLYVDSATQDRKLQCQQNKMIPKDWGHFKPQNKWINQVEAVYSYKELEQNKKGNVVRNLNEMGKPVTENPNVKVNVNLDYLHKFPQYKQDEYDRPQQFTHKQRLAHQKAMGEQPNFRTWDNVDKPFNSDKKTFGLDIPIKPKKEKPFKPNIFPHDAPFKYPNPAKQGYNKTIGKFPTYKEDPYKILKRKPKDDSVKRDPFKLTNPHDKVKPCPSISFNSTNLRRVMTAMSHNKY